MPFSIDNSLTIRDEKEVLPVRRLSPLILCFSLLIILYLPTAVSASGIITFKYDDFEDESLIETNGDADIVQSPSVIRLTEAVGNQQGSAYYRDYVSLVNERSFSTYFTFRMDPKGTTGADGIVFILNNNTNDLGESGGGMGYSGIDNSVGVEFDTYDNESDHGDGGLGVNHIAINVNGDVDNPVASATQSENSGYNMKSGNLYHVWIDYDGPDDRIEVRMNQESAVRPTDPVISHEGLDLLSILYQDEIYVGFSAATGGAYAEHLIEDWYFNNDYTPLDVENEQYDVAPSDVILTTEEIDQGETELTAEVTDSEGSGVPDVEVSFSSTLGTLSDSTIETDDDGRATVTLTNEDAGGPYVKAVASGGAYDEAMLPPYPPTLEDSTTTSITLAEISGAEYRMDGGGWRTDREFSGLDPATGYDFEARMAETESTPSSPASDSSTLETKSVVSIDPKPQSLESGDWTNEEPVEISISAEDDVEYRLDDSGWTEYTGSFEITSEGEHLVQARTTDSSENGQDSLEFGIDTTDPSITGTFQPEDGGEMVDGWTSDNLVFDYSASDDVSAVAAFDYSLDGGDTWAPAEDPFVVTDYGERNGPNRC
ncbi:MAG: lectin-like domain-containing protein [Bacillota bacterium]